LGKSERDRPRTIQGAGVTDLVLVPELKGFPPGGRRTLIDDAMLRVANHQTVLEIYSRFRSERLPLASLIDSNWLLFRHTQMNLFAALEFTARYGADATNVTSKRLHNDVLDIDYLIAASMVGASPAEIFNHVSFSSWPAQMACLFLGH